MPISQMPRYAQHEGGVGRKNLKQRLRLRAYAHNSPIRQNQPIILPQPHGLRQIEQNLTSGFRAQQQTPPETIIEAEQN